MGQALFFHLTRRPLEATLPTLLEKSLAQGWRVLVRGTSPGRLAWLDEKLWLGPDERFLPHGLAGGPHDSDQPVLLTDEMNCRNGAACLMAIDGAEVEPGEVEKFERTCILFDGNDASALDRARDQWTTLTGAGVKAQYWSEEGGKWEMKSESA